MIVFCCVGDFPVRDQEIFEEVVNGSGGGDLGMLFSWEVMNERKIVFNRFRRLCLEEGDE